jgi:hypothetical protein
MDDLQFSQTGKKWTIEEDQQLIVEYNAGNDIVEISQIHKRLPNGIATRLVSLNLIIDKINARGYTSYKNSDYYLNYLNSEKRKGYLEKITQSKNTKIEKAGTEQEKEIKNKKLSTNDDLKISQDISNIKNELKEIKTSIVELNEMLKAIYEFGDC